MDDGYYKPYYKWQLVDQIYAIEKGRYSKKSIARKTQHQLWGWRFKLISAIRAKEKCLLDYQKEQYIDEDSFVESMKPNQ